MENVHGIAVAGGSFPAEIWRRFMERATRYSPRAGLRAAEDLPDWKPFQRGQYAIQYVYHRHDQLDHDRHDDDDDPATTTTAETTTDAARRRCRCARRRREHRATIAPPPPTTTTTTAAADDRPPPPPTTPSRRRRRAAGDDDAPPRPAAVVRERASARRLAGDGRSSRRSCSARSRCRAAGCSAARSSATCTSTGEYGDALLAGRVPYRDFFVEYPPGAIPLFAAALAVPRRLRTTRSSRSLMTACCARGDLLRRLRAGARGRAAACALGRGALPRARADRARAGVAEHLRRVAGGADRRRGGGARHRPRPARARRCSAWRRRRSCTRCCSCRWRSPGSGATRGARTAAAARLLRGRAAVLVVPWLALSPGGVWDSVHSQVGRALHTESLGASVLLVADRLGLLRRARRRGCARRCRATSPAGCRTRSRRSSAVLAVVAALAPGLVAAPPPGRARAALRGERRRLPGVHEGALAAVPRLADPARAVRRRRCRRPARRRARAGAELVLPLPRALGGRPAGLDAARPEPRPGRALRRPLARKTSTPSRSKTSRQSGLRRSRTSAAAAGQRRDPVGVARAGLVGRDPGRVGELRQAEHPAAGGEVRAEHVRGADDRVRRHERERALGDPVVLGHAPVGLLEVLAARDGTPERDRAEPVVRDQRDGDDRCDDQRRFGVGKRRASAAARARLATTSGGIAPAM